jgi:hypothetical protein
VKDQKIAYQYDFDGTLADNSHRRHLAPEDFANSTEEQWDKWSAACMGDLPIVGTIKRMQLDYEQGQIHVVSSRGASASRQSRLWLNTYADAKWDYLRLRHRGDRRHGWEIKVENILELRAYGIEVVLAYEDLKSEAEKIFELTGVPVVLINPAYDWVEDLKKTLQDQAD